MEFIDVSEQISFKNLTWLSIWDNSFLALSDIFDRSSARPKFSFKFWYNFIRGKRSCVSIYIRIKTNLNESDLVKLLKSIAVHKTKMINTEKIFTSEMFYIYAFFIKYIWNKDGNHTIHPQPELSNSKPIIIGDFQGYCI